MFISFQLYWKYGNMFLKGVALVLVCQLIVTVSGFTGQQFLDKVRYLIAECKTLLWNLTIQILKFQLVPPIDFAEIALTLLIVFTLFKNLR